jgi:hypothetical protein
MGVLQRSSDIRTRFRSSTGTFDAPSFDDSLTASSTSWNVKKSLYLGVCTRHGTRRHGREETPDKPIQRTDFAGR